MERISDERLAAFADWQHPKYSTGVHPQLSEVAHLARELRAYRESGVLEALKGLVACDCPSCEDAGRAAIAKLQAIESGAVDESKGMKN